MPDLLLLSQPSEVNDGCHTSSWPFKSTHTRIEVWGTQKWRKREFTKTTHEKKGNHLITFKISLRVKVVEVGETEKIPYRGEKEATRKHTSVFLCVL